MPAGAEMLMSHVVYFSNCTVNSAVLCRKITVLKEKLS